MDISETDLLEFWADCRKRRYEQLQMLEASLEEVRYRGDAMCSEMYQWVKEAKDKFDHAASMVRFFESRRGK